MLFQDGVTKAGASLVAERNLITKVYFPRMVDPAGLVVLAGLVDFALSVRGSARHDGLLSACPRRAGLVDACRCSLSWRW